MDKSKLKKRVRDMTEEEREELGQLLLESVLERLSEEERTAGGSQPGRTRGVHMGDFDVIVDGEPKPAAD